MTGEPATVLVVDDEPGYVDAYTTWLSDRYEVRSATDGDAALEAVDPSVDVVLLDRRMPGLSGGEVLDRIRDRGLACQVAMITAVEPEIDVVDMAFDDYLVKPVTKEALRDLVEDLLVRATLDRQAQRCFSLASKKTVLEASLDRDRLESLEEYQRLVRELEAAQSRVDATLEELISEGTTAAAYYDL